MPDDEPKDPHERVHEAWKNWIPADVAKELEPWPRSADAEGADLDCPALAAPTAILLVAERQPDSAIAAAIARGREKPHPVPVDRPIDVIPSVVMGRFRGDGCSPLCRLLDGPDRRRGLPLKCICGRYP